MAYVTIPQFAPGTHDQLTITEMNQILNNVTYVLGGRQKNFTQYTGTITSTSATFAALSTANARITVSTHSGRVFGFFLFNFVLGFSVSGSATGYFDVLVDGTTRLGDATVGLQYSTSQALGVQLVIPFIAEGLSDASHTFDLSAKLTVGGGSGYQINVSNIVKMAWEG